jgi:hypothetical protein
MESVNMGCSQRSVTDGNPSPRLKKTPWLVYLVAARPASVLAMMLGCSDCNAHTKSIVKDRRTPRLCWHSSVAKGGWWPSIVNTG